MSTMSYCAFENTSRDMDVCVTKMLTMASEYDNLADALDGLDSHEKRGLDSLIADAREIIRLYDALADRE